MPSGSSNGSGRLGSPRPSSSGSLRMVGPRLSKELKLSDVYVICTAAMFSSGFFLLPGIAAARAGPAVVLAYLLSGILILPAMLSKAELATAMPRAGGTYYFLDRTLGPVVGTVAGFGTWLALILKAGFALIGMRAYLEALPMFSGLPVKTVAVGLTLVFLVLNVLGAKETTGLLRLLVGMLLMVLTLFCAFGFAALVSKGVVRTVEAQFTPFAPFGADGVVGTVGLVFVSYVGLTKIASIAEEVENPDRNIPLGMTLSLCTVLVVYCFGVALMVALLEPGVLRGSLTPVADAATAALGELSWPPPWVGLVAIVAAALAAFAGMANTGIMSASRYPLAMARDRLLPEVFAGIGRFNTPTTSIVATCGVLVLCLLALDAEGVAKVASAIQLLIFMLVNLAVILMRESQIESYDPGFRSPLYPWVQLAGILFPVFLIAEMGWLPVLSTLGVVGASVGWYFHYARDRVQRTGAIYHIFARLGRRRFEGLDVELRGILREKGLRAEDPYDEVVARAFVLDVEPEETYEGVALKAARLLATRIDRPADEIAAALLEDRPLGLTPAEEGVALPHCRLEEALHPELVLVRCRGALRATGAEDDAGRYRAVIFLASPAENPGQHLRILAQLAGHIDDERFMVRWLKAEQPQDLRETLLRDDRFLSMRLQAGERNGWMIGRRVRDLPIPTTCLIAVIRRGEDVKVPRGNTVLEEGDRVTFIGEADAMEQLYLRCCGDGTECTGAAKE